MWFPSSNNSRRNGFVPCALAALALTGCDFDREVAVAVDPPDPTAAAVMAAGLPERVTFNAHIRPILSNACFSCHGFDPETREAGLRLDTAEGAYAALRGAVAEFAIVPGDPDRSEVLARVTSRDPDLQMPPPDFHKEPLTNQQVELIRRWIEQGAEYEQHWSFEPVRRAEPPVPAGRAGEVANPIDAFVLDRLAREGIEPSPVADRATLLRRLSLDLTGLPPTLAELDAFLADTSGDAYGKQVERLLASPRYGERMAVWWLDVARYADTVGYHGDQTQRAFPYRDYVIGAFNDNMPFDRFTREQLAGDLLDNPTDDQRIATGFLRLNMMTREGGAQPDEYLNKYMGDRIRVLGGAWLGLTTGCAECHDHKFDPISAKDYYSLGAFFGDVRQWGLYTHYGNQPNPDLKGWSNESPFPPEIHRRNAALEMRISQLRDDLTHVLSARAEERHEEQILEWGDMAAAFLRDHSTGWAAMQVVGTEIEEGAYQATRHDDRSVLIHGAPDLPGRVTVRLRLPEAPVRSILMEALPDPSNGGYVGRAPDGRFAVKTSFAVDRSDGVAEELDIAWSQADKRQPHRYSVTGNQQPMLENEWRSGPAHLEFPRDAARHPQHAVFHLETPLRAGTGRVLVVTLSTKDLGRVRFHATPFGGAIPGFDTAHRDALAEALARPRGERSATDRGEIAAAWVHGTWAEADLGGDYTTLRDAILEYRAGYAHSLVVETLPEDRRLPVRFLPRGDWMNPGEEVKPALPEYFSKDAVPPTDRTLNRLDLVEWLMGAQNPLTSRHFMNRMWHLFFGRGLSAVVDDLGSQGEMPTHPELLDWLASEFRDSGWDVKQMVRLVVTSDTYRREAATREDLLDLDPDNRLLAGQSARRLDAEFIRDNALAVSGLLKGEIIGGPSIKPYQPEGYYDNLNFPIRDYRASTGDEQYRRGLYMHWQRTFLHPMLAAFDAPSREECTPSRFQANSPQQALVLLNDPTFVEAARAFAQRVALELPDAGDADKIRYALKLAVARDPREGELDSLLGFLETQRNHYRRHGGDAAALLRTGQTGEDPGEGPATADLAAWTQLCRVILNLHETITRY